ncbi:MAG: hypothetical protein QG614_42 [Patescibacteria group bacterium]|nr:hypothetical protein [Patescibacteria group bacterium]
MLLLTTNLNCGAVTPSQIKGDPAEPRMYKLKIKAIFSYETWGFNITVHDFFSNHLAEIFHISPKAMYSLLTDAVKQRKIVLFGSYPKDIGRTMILRAEEYIRCVGVDVDLDFSLVEI